MTDPSEMHEPAATFGQPAESPRVATGTPAPEPWSHPWHDQLGLLYHRAMAEKIRCQPALLDIARGNLRRWMAAERDATPSQSRREWGRILETEGVEAILRLITDPSEEGHRRRQSSPFAGILTPEESRAIRDSLL